MTALEMYEILGRLLWLIDTSEFSETESLELIYKSKMWKLPERHMIIMKRDQRKETDAD